MGRTSASASSGAKRKIRPAQTPEAREKKMIGLAMDVAEQRLLDGTASPQIVVHFLKLATEREKTEREILEKQAKLLEAKTEALQSQKRVEELYADALNAMKSYQGVEVPVEDENV